LSTNLVNDDAPERSRWETARNRLELSDRRARAGAASAGKALTVAVSSLYEHAIDRMLATPTRVRSADEGRALLASDERSEGIADHVQRVVIAAVPALRIVLRGAKVAKVPWALLASAGLSVGMTARTGAREVQVIGSLIAHRIEEATGEPADPALVKKLTVELYLAPKRPPELLDRRLRLRRLVGRWVFRGALGRGSGRAASKALKAAERLDVQGQIARWTDLGPAGAPRAASDAPAVSPTGDSG
jgi:hypothetical protein